MRHRRRAGQPGGFMTVIAVLMLGLVTAAVAVLAAAGTADVRRTRMRVADAQLRQLLLAAGVDVAARAATWGDAPAGSWTMATPPELAGSAVRVRATTTAAGHVDVTVDADGEGRHASQRMTWARTDGRWQLVGVWSDGV